MFNRCRHYEFVPLTPLEESFEDDNTTLPVQNTAAVDTSFITSSIPSLSIVSDDHTTMLSSDHPMLASRDAQKARDPHRVTAVTKAGQYRGPPTVITSLVDPVLQNKLSRYLNGSFDSTVGYTTTDITSDTDSVDHVKRPLTECVHKVTHRRVDNDVLMEDKRTQSVTHRGIQAMTHRGTQGMTDKETQKATELDNLWKHFIATPLYTDWVKPKRSSDAKTAMCYCEELKQLEYKSKHCTKLPMKPQVTTQAHTTQSSSNITSSDSRTTLYTDSAVQTSPSLLQTTKSTQCSDTSDPLLNDCPCISSHVIKGSPPSSDSSFGDQGSCDITESCDVSGSCEPPASLTKLSLQEACRLFKKDFISNCRHRQRMIHRTRKQREEEIIVNRHQAALVDMARQYKSQHQNGEQELECYTMIHLIEVHVDIISKPFPPTGKVSGRAAHHKMTPREMYEQTKKSVITTPHHIM